MALFRFTLAWIFMLSCGLLLQGRVVAQSMRDVSSAVQFSIQTDIPEFDRVTRKMIGAAHVSATVTTTTQLLEPAHLVIHFTSGDPAVIAMPGALGGPGTQPYGTYYFDLSGQTPGSTLQAGDQFSQDMTFVVDRGVQFLFEPQLYVRALPTGENNPPSFTTQPVTEIVDGTFWYYQPAAVDPEGDFVSYSLVQADASIRMTTGGLLNWVPTDNDVGTHRVVIQASDPAGASTTQDFEITVGALNHPPKITSLPTYFAKQGEAYQYELTAVDPESAPLEFALQGTVPSQAAIDPSSGTLTWHPTQPGPVDFTAVVTDDGGATDTQQWTVKVYQDLGDLEVLAPAGNYVIAPGEPLELTAQANYAVALFSVDPLPAHAFFYDNTFRFVPDASQVGFYTLSFIAKLDGMLASSVITVEVRGSNAPPVFNPIPDQQLTAGERLNLTIGGTDPDGDPLQFSAPGLALPNAQFNATQRSFTFAPQPGQAGTYTIVLQLSDGHTSVNESFKIQVDEPVAPLDPLQLSVNPPVSPTFQIKQNISGNITGAEGVLPTPPAEGLITGLAPAAATQGSTATIELTGFHSAWVQDEVQPTFGAGISLLHFEVLSPTSARATIQVDPSAVLGTRAVRMLTSSGEQVCSIVFSVTPGATALRGLVLDDFTSQPLQGARVAINGSAVQTLTDAEGRFLLEPLPTQNQSVIITRNNYEVKKLELSISPNKTLDLGTIPLRALARTPLPPSSIKPGPNLASVLNRGMSSRGGGMSVDEAIALIQDAIVAVGGNQVGVLDANFQQLNPAVQGVGMFTLTPGGVRAQAERLVEGQLMPLGDFAEVITTLFRFPGVQMTSQRLIAGLQLAVDEAWANPQDPGSLMAIMVFNEGQSLSPRPPHLTTQTPLNSFQAHLLFTSFIAANYTSISASIDRQIEIMGIDVESQIVRRDGDIESNLRADAQAAAGRPAGRMGSADADPIFSPMGDVPPHNPNIGVTVADPDENWTATERLRQTYGKVWKQVSAGLMTEFVVGAVKNAVYTFAVQSAFTMALGSSGGLGGALGALSLSAVQAAAMGVADAAFQKFFVVLAATMAAYALTPEDCTIDRSELDQEGNYVIFFDRSVTEVDRLLRTPPPTSGQLDSNLMNYTYQLYSFPDEKTVDAAKAKLVFVKPTLDMSDPDNSKTPRTGRLKFVIPPGLLTQGSNFMRISTYQFVHNSDQELVEGVPNFDTDADGALSPQEFPGTPEEFAQQDLNKDGKLVQSEFNEHKAPIPGVNTKLAPWMTMLVPPAKFVLSKEEYEEKIGSKLEALQQAEITRSNSLRSEIVRTLDVDINMLEGEIKTQKVILDSAQSQVLTEWGQKPSQVAEVLDYADRRGTSGANGFLDSNSPQSLRAQALLGGNELSEEVTDALHQRALAKPELEQASRSKAVTSGAVEELEQKLGMMKSAHAVDNTTFNFDIKYSTLEEGTNKPQRITARVQADEAGIEQVEQLLRVERAKTQTHTASMAKNQAIMENSAQRIMADQIGQSTRNYANRVSPVMAEHKATDARLQVLSKEKLEISTDMKVAQQSKFQENTKTTKLKDEQLLRDFNGYSKQSAKRISNSLDVAGSLVSNADTLFTVINTVKTLSSRFSNCHILFKIDRSPRQSFPPPILATFNAADPAGLFRALPDPDSLDTRKNIINNGFIEWSHPAEKQAGVVWDAGFPSDFLDSDEEGRIYVLNMNSTSMYGGRIFRFNTFQGVVPAREMVGAVKYFNLNLMYSNPALPIAMCVGPRIVRQVQSGGSVESSDVYVAEIDPLKNTKNILRVPTSDIDAFPNSYENGANRNRIVGQSVLSDSRFAFSGPSDMVAGFPPQVEDLGVGTGLGSIFLSDESVIWCMYPATQGSDDWQLHELIRTPGRRWSGLAVDRQGTLYFADYAKGEVYCLTHSEVRELLAGSQAAGEQALLDKAWLLFDGLEKPGDIEIESLSEHTQGTMFISTQDQVIRLPLPLVGRLTGSPMQMVVQRFDRQDDVKILANHGNQFRIDLDYDQLRHHRVDLRVQVRDSESLQASWVGQVFTWSAPGMNFVKGFGQ